MKPNSILPSQRPALATFVALALAAPTGFAATPAAAPKPAAQPVAQPVALSTEPARIGPEVKAVVGKSTLLRLPEPIERISVGNPAVADVTLVSQTEVYLLGKDLGTTNVIVWSKGGRATVVDVQVGADITLLERELRELLPSERDIRVKTSADSIVLQGVVADAVKVDQAVEIAQAWVRRLTRGLVLPVNVGEGKGGAGTTIQVGETRGTQAAQLAGPRVINMLRVRGAQQVMLEVKVAEVSKTLLDKLGVTLAQQIRTGSTTFNFLSQSNFFNQLLGAVSVTRPNGMDGLQIDAQRDDGLVKMLAEPTIMAISGQEASFNAGGKIFIPVARENNATGGTTITLEEKEFGVGVKFTPTVLEGGRINLRVAPQVSELQQTGTPFTTVGGVTSVLPSFTVRRAETTVQLSDGQSFMIAGLVKNNVAQTINRFPGLGDIPVLGALFRSTEFQTDKTELMFVITPRLVKPLPANYALPTDQYIEPSVAERLLEGKMEGTPPAQSGGFEMK